MNCPYCQADTFVATCRKLGTKVHRFRKCPAGHKFHTVEQFNSGPYPWRKKVRKETPPPDFKWLDRIAAALAP
jgi:transcriptional regulator NrdR family protein